MNILVTGAAGFVGKNLVAALQNLHDGKDRTRPALTVGEIFTYDIDTDPACLAEYCKKAVPERTSCSTSRGSTVRRTRASL